MQDNTENTTPTTVSSVPDVLRVERVACGVLGKAASPQIDPPPNLNDEGHQVVQVVVLGHLDVTVDRCCLARTARGACAAAPQLVKAAIVRAAPRVHPQPHTRLPVPACLLVVHEQHATSRSARDNLLLRL